MEIAASYKPCFGVGGDLYDFIKLDADNLAIAIADVIGKGIPAALTMSSFRGMIRAYADGGHKRHTMVEIIRKLNNSACDECRDGEFITFFYAIINTKEPSITYCNCGHEPGLLWRGDKIRELKKGGLVLGVTKETGYEIETVELKHNDSLLFYTDGLTEVFRGDEEFGPERLLDVFLKCRAEKADDILDALWAAIEAFSEGGPQGDDMTALALCREAGLTEIPA